MQNVRRCYKVLHNQPKIHCKINSYIVIVSGYAAACRASVIAQESCWKLKLSPCPLSQNIEKTVEGALKILTFFYAIFLGQIKVLKTLCFTKKILGDGNEPVALAGITGNNAVFRRKS